MCVEWIRENCQGDTYEFEVEDCDLNSARFAYKTVSQTALDVGSEVHAAIEKYLKGVMVGKSDHSEIWGDSSCEQVANAFNAFLGWMEEHEVKPISLEQKLYGPYWAGTCDFVGWFNGKVYVIDWKTSKAFYPEMRYQAAAYRWAWDVEQRKRYSHQNGIRVDCERNDWLDKHAPSGCGILRIDKTTGEPEWKDTTKTYEKDLKIFNAMAELYILRHPIIARRAGWKP